MKKLFYLLACALMVVAIPACSPDGDDDNLPSEGKLIGSWKQTHAKFTEKVDGNVVNSGSINVPAEAAWFWTFNEDGSFVMTIEGDSEHGTWSIEQNKLTINHNEGGDDVCTIKSLSKSKLVINAVSNDGSSANALVYLEYTFVKQK